MKYRRYKDEWGRWYAAGRERREWKNATFVDHYGHKVIADLERELGLNEPEMDPLTLRIFNWTAPARGALT
jgi:hypothetical protein